MLTVTEVAKALRVSDMTVRRWVHAGKVRAIRPSGEGGNWRIPASELDRILGTAPPPG